MLPNVAAVVSDVECAMEAAVMRPLYIRKTMGERALRVRPGAIEDLTGVMDVVKSVIPMMRADGNFQWDVEYPNRSVFERDVALEQLWVVESDGIIAGVAAVTTDQEPEYAQVGWDLSEQAMVVHRLAVSPAFQGRGVAALLMRQAEIVARERNIAVLRVDTNVVNQASQKLFPKIGYVLAGEIGLSFRPGLRFRCYEKRLL